MDKTTTSDVPAKVQELLGSARERRASDQYWLPDRDGVRVRCRVAGVQEDQAVLPLDVGLQCLTHIKVLAKLLTYRTRVAQDGVIRLDDGAEMRVATMPTVFGERITIRMIDPQRGPKLPEDLGFPDDVVQALRNMVMRPYGLIILTGPTGCGKTTTIYSLLRELLRQNQDPASIITLEDPIESIVDGISQSAVTSESEDWSYEDALRSALRQDVKTLVVGEMRDSGVVRVVLDAALTGHRILTTYHAGDIPGVYARLLHLDFEPFLIASTITGVVTQRLVKGVDGELVPVVAVLDPDDEWREFICARPDLSELRKKIAQYPLADLRHATENAIDQGKLSKTQASLITGG